MKNSFLLRHWAAKNLSMPELLWVGEPGSVRVAEEGRELRHARDAVTPKQSDEVAEGLLRWAGRHVQQDRVADAFDAFDGLDAVGEMEES
jgi:hypothetical protein